MHCHLSMKDTLQLLLQPLSIYYFAGVFGCLFVTNKRQNGSTDQAQIFCGTSQDPSEGLWMFRITKKLYPKAFDFCKI